MSSISKTRFEVDFNGIVKLVFPREITVLRKDIYRGLNTLLNITQIKAIRSISQFENNSTWLVGFDQTVKVNELVGKKVTILDQSITLEPFGRSPSKVRFVDVRFLWLPPKFNHEAVRFFLEKNNVPRKTIINIMNEFCTDEGLEEIETGIIRAKIECDENLFNHLSTITGVKKIFGFKSFIIKVGDPIKCIFCNQTGHIKKDCQALKLKLSKKCNNCSKVGHETSECNLALRIAEDVTTELKNLDDEPTDLTYPQTKEASKDKTANVTVSQNNEKLKHKSTPETTNKRPNEITSSEKKTEKFKKWRTWSDSDHEMEENLVEDITVNDQTLQVDQVHRTKESRDKAAKQLGSHLNNPACSKNSEKLFKN